MQKRIISKLKLIFVPGQENEYRPKFLESQFLIYWLIFLLFLKLIPIPLLIYFPNSAFFADITKSALMNLVNNEREFSGVPSLKENPKLNLAASLKAKDMIEKDYFSHVSPEGISPWYWFGKVNYDYQFAGENLAIGFLDSEEVYQAWFDSSLHKKNLLNSVYQETGIAVLRGDFQGNDVAVVVQLFGSPKTDVSGGIISEEKPVIQEEEMSPAPLERTEVKGDELTFSLFSFITSDYYNLIQGITYFSLILIIASLIINIFVRFDIQHRDLVFKAAGFILLLIFFILLDKGLIIKLIPHNLTIY